VGESDDSHMTDAKELLSQELIEKIESCAREQNRKPSEVLEEALGRYMALRRLERLSENGERLARERSIREQDVEDLVQQVRQENKARGQ
jgi:predicted transcriptional regulator